MEIIEQLKQLARKCFYKCKKVNSVLFDDNNESGAMCYLNLALADMAVLKSVYYSNCSLLKNDDLEELFNQFDVFSQEITNNFVTEHSHQWSNIEYERLAELFEEVFGITSNS